METKEEDLINIFLKSKNELTRFELGWEVIQKLSRKKKIGILRKDETGTRNFIHNHKTKLLSGDKLVIWKSEHQNLKGKKSSSINLPIYNENDEYLEELVNFFKKMLIFENEDFCIINKLPNISSQGGKLVKLNLYFLINHYLHFTNEPKEIEKRGLK